MGKIRILSPALISRIAAGECVERPASVVKELAENSLDAGAARIEIQVLDGGRALIAVSDDGGGMSPDDLALSVVQHATSKLGGDDDLFCIHTLGFRGEALASIGSVARLEIVSRQREAEVGYRIRVEGGQAERPVPCAAPEGTSIEVRDLFYAVPARRKFLRTPATEMGQITEQVARLALAYPNVSFHLRHQERTAQKLPATTDRRRRIADLFGQELADVLIPVRREGVGVVVDGLIAPPAESRGSGKWEYVFVNGRFVRDRFVSHAIKEAYRSLIDPSRYPVAFLWITIDTQQVDVNVHPTKIEVRWRDSNYVHGQVLSALRDRFLSMNLDHRLRTGAADVRTASPPVFELTRSAAQRAFELEPQQHELEQGLPPALRYPAPLRAGGSPTAAPDPRAEIAPTPTGDDYRTRVHQAMVDFFMRSPAGRADLPGARPPEPGGKRAEAGPVAPAERKGPDRPDANSPAPAGPAANSIPAAPAAPASPAAPRDSAAPSSAAARSSAPAGASAHAPALSQQRAIQIHNAFLVVETPEGMMIIDQHALHERILYEELRRRVGQRSLSSQRLLLPEVVRIPADRLGVLEEHAETLGHLGIELAATGPGSVALHAFPTLLAQRVDAAGFVRDLLDLLSEKGARPATDTLLHKVLDMMACKAAVKAGDPLTPEEIAALLARRETAERSSHCPHGRPTTLQLTIRDLERQFKRR